MLIIFYSIKFFFFLIKSFFLLLVFSVPVSPGHMDDKDVKVRVYKIFSPTKCYFSFNTVQNHFNVYFEQPFEKQEHKDAQNDSSKSMLSGSVEESSISETVTQQHDFSLVTAGAMCAYSEELANYR